MNTHTDKTTETKSNAAANGMAVQQGVEHGGTFQLEDNRPEAIAQRKIQEAANNSPQVTQLKSLQVMANSSPQVKQLRAVQAMADTYILKPDPGSPAGKQTAQLKMEFDSGSEYLDTEKNSKIISAPYISVQNAAKLMQKTVTVVEGVPPEGTASYSPQIDDWKGRILVRPLIEKDNQINEDTTVFNETLAAMAHETQHAIDDLSKIVKYRPRPQGGRIGPEENVIRTEWRAWAAEAAVIHQRWKAGQPISQIKEGLMYSYRSKSDFASVTSTAFSRTKFYLNRHHVLINPTDVQITAWIYTKNDWLTEAIKHFYNLIPEGISNAWNDAPDVAGHTEDGGMEEVF